MQPLPGSLQSQVNIFQRYTAYFFPQAQLHPLYSSSANCAVNGSYKSYLTLGAECISIKSLFASQPTPPPRLFLFFLPAQLTSGRKFRLVFNYCNRFSLPTWKVFEPTHTSLSVHAHASKVSQPRIVHLLTFIIWLISPRIPSRFFCSNMPTLLIYYNVKFSNYFICFYANYRIVFIIVIKLLFFKHLLNSASQNKLIYKHHMRITKRLKRGWEHQEFCYSQHFLLTRGAGAARLALVIMHHRTVRLWVRLSRERERWLCVVLSSSCVSLVGGHGRG